MTIQVGDRIPPSTVMYMKKDGPASLTTDKLFKGRKVAMFGLPGAFTPTCSAAHLPGYVARADKLLAKGIDRIVCISVNDAFVMDAWGRQHNVDDNVMMAADGNAEFTKAIGLDVDLTERGMGIRSQRYSMLVEDGMITQLNIEAPGKFEVSDADTLLASL
ncbi:MAG: peroxiredoxin [Gammaproteobacteria bacterium]|nr:peroxiredoxin [Gammaproteobacteria bacterium]